MTFESVAVIGAFCTLIGVILKWEGTRNKSFIEFVEKTMVQIEEYHTLKNNHLERVANKFTDSLLLFSEKIDRANENNANNISVLDDCARALNDYNHKK
jgi:3-methyladenine DNA glycosylase AlkC